MNKKLTIVLAAVFVLFAACLGFTLKLQADMIKTQKELVKRIDQSITRLDPNQSANNQPVNNQFNQPINNQPNQTVNNRPAHRTHFSAEVYYLHKNGAQLVKEIHELPIPNSDDRTSRAKAALAELIYGKPLSPDCTSVIPKDTDILDIKPDGSLVTLDFSKEILKNPGTGVMGEILAVQAIVNTVTSAETFGDNAEVMIKVEGKPVSTLWGHLEIGSEKLKRDLSYVRNK